MNTTNKQNKLANYESFWYDVEADSKEDVVLSLIISGLRKDIQKETGVAPHYV